jgi:hypothetical protein
MRTPSTSPPHTQGPTTTSPPFEEARRRFLAARHQLTCAALEELIVRVRTRHPEASGMLFICDDVEDGLYLAEVTDRTGMPLGAGGPLLDDRTTAQVLGNLCGTDLAAVHGVRHDPVAMTFEVEIDALD